MKKCGICGDESSDSSKVCQGCGADLTLDESAFKIIDEELLESLVPSDEEEEGEEAPGGSKSLIRLNLETSLDLFKSARESSMKISELEGKGYPFIGGARPFRECEFAFVHPKAVNGVLLEVIDDKTEVPK